VEPEGEEPAAGPGQGGGRAPHQHRLAHRGGQSGKSLPSGVWRSFFGGVAHGLGVA
jgi:hypothetical protein